VECVIGTIPRGVGYGSEKFRIVSLHNCDIGFVGATPQFNSTGPYRFGFRFLVIGGSFFPMSHFISRVL